MRWRTPSSSYEAAKRLPTVPRTRTSVEKAHDRVARGVEVVPEDAVAARDEDMGDVADARNPIGYPGALTGDDERRAARPRWRLRRHLAPGDDHRARRPLPTKAPAGSLDEMLARLLLEGLARSRVERAVRE